MDERTKDNQYICTGMHTSAYTRRRIFFSCNKEETGDGEKKEQNTCQKACKIARHLIVDMQKAK